jgi:hypothetical protein
MPDDPFTADESTAPAASAIEVTTGSAGNAGGARDGGGSAPGVSLAGAGSADGHACQGGNGTRLSLHLVGAGTRVAGAQWLRAGAVFAPLAARLPLQSMGAGDGGAPLLHACAVFDSQEGNAGFLSGGSAPGAGSADVGSAYCHACLCGSEMTVALANNRGQPAEGNAAAAPDAAAAVAAITALASDDPNKDEEEASAPTELGNIAAVANAAAAFAASDAGDPSEGEGEAAPARLAMELSS